MNWQKNRWIGVFFVISGLATSSTAAPVFEEAPKNGFVKVSTDHPEAQNIKRRFGMGHSGSYPAEALRLLRDEDLRSLSEVSEESRQKAIALFKAGKVVAVDSVVGNATRLGNPPGGKGAVPIGELMTFLEAKIFRLAVDSFKLGRPIKQILWTSDENKAETTKILSAMLGKIEKMPNLDPIVRSQTIEYLKGNNIVLMAQSTLFPVIDSRGELSVERMRNLGAGELVPTIFRSGAAEKVGLSPDSMIVFSNIDFDLNYLDVVAASIEAKNPDLMQVHVKTNASGGSAYWLKEGETWRIVPLEGIEVPPEVLAKAPTLNTNTVVIQGRALMPELYQDLPLPFEAKEYEGKKFHLPKLSLSDIGKHPAIRSAVILADSNAYFFTGSKNLELLQRDGPREEQARILRWNEQARFVLWGKGGQARSCNQGHRAH